MTISIVRPEPPDPYPPVYALVTLSQLAPVLADCPDGEEACESLYQDHLNDKLAPLGITVLAVDIEDWTHSAIHEALDEIAGKGE